MFVMVVTMVIVNCWIVFQESKACNQEIEYANDVGVQIVPVRAQNVRSDGKSYRPRGKVRSKVYSTFFV